MHSLIRSMAENRHCAPQAAPCRRQTLNHRSPPVKHGRGHVTIFSMPRQLHVCWPAHSAALIQGTARLTPANRFLLAEALTLRYLEGHGWAPPATATLHRLESLPPLAPVPATTSLLHLDCSNSPTTWKVLLVGALHLIEHVRRGGSPGACALGMLPRRKHRGQIWPARPPHSNARQAKPTTSSEHNILSFTNIFMVQLVRNGIPCLALLVPMCMLKSTNEKDQVNNRAPVAQRLRIRPTRNLTSHTPDARTRADNIMHPRDFSLPGPPALSAAKQAFLPPRNGLRTCFGKGTSKRAAAGTSEVDWRPPDTHSISSISTRASADQETVCGPAFRCCGAGNSEMSTACNRPGRQPHTPATSPSDPPSPAVPPHA